MTEEIPLSQTQVDTTYELANYIDELIDRAMYYKEHESSLPVFERMREIVQTMIDEQERFM